MNQPEFILTSGTKIQTHPLLGSIEGLLVALKHHVNRKPNTPGTIIGPVGGHGGDVYWVKNEYGSVAVYSFPEFELVP